ncbi:MAG TPA: hypothetical protein VFI22_05930 [Thermomicrobiales bacterium]|nr:hypothetical protein [Thermomicrobiales bacterium]
MLAHDPNALDVIDSRRGDMLVDAARERRAAFAASAHPRRALPAPRRRAAMVAALVALAALRPVPTADPAAR